MLHIFENNFLILWIKLNISRSPDTATLPDAVQGTLAWAFRDMRKDAYKTWLVMQRRPHLKRMTKVQQWKSGWTGTACSYKNEHVTAIQDMEGQSQRQKMVSENNESAKDDR